jgi:hypothetical protein
MARMTMPAIFRCRKGFFMKRLFSPATRPLTAMVLAATLGWAVSPAHAQTAAAPAPAAPAMAMLAAAPAQTKPIRLHGSITAVHKDHIDFMSRAGTASTVALLPNTRYVQVRKTSLRHVKPGDFVGVGAMEQPDGSLKAVEVTVFPEAMRGTGEGNRPWEMPKSQMTNGTVGKVAGTSAKTVTVSYKGGEKTIDVPKDIPIVGLKPGTAKLLKAGAKVSINAVKTGDNSFNALSVNVGAKGMTPPT